MPRADHYDVWYAHSSITLTLTLTLTHIHSRVRIHPTHTHDMISDKPHARTCFDLATFDLHMHALHAELVPFSLLCFY